jgi:hypothetical protein
MPHRGWEKLKRSGRGPRPPTCPWESCYRLVGVHLIMTLRRTYRTLPCRARALPRSAVCSPPKSKGLPSPSTGESCNRKELTQGCVLSRPSLARKLRKPKLQSYSACEDTLVSRHDHTVISLRRYIQLFRQSRALQAQGLRVKRRGWLLVIEGSGTYNLSLKVRSVYRAHFPAVFASRWSQRRSYAVSRSAQYRVTQDLGQRKIRTPFSPA